MVVVKPPPISSPQLPPIDVPVAPAADRETAEVSRCCAPFASKLLLHRRLGCCCYGSRWGNGASKAMDTPRPPPTSLRGRPSHQTAKSDCSAYTAAANTAVKEVLRMWTWRLHPERRTGIQTSLSPSIARSTAVTANRPPFPCPDRKSHLEQNLHTCWVHLSAKIAQTDAANIC